MVKHKEKKRDFDWFGTFLLILITIAVICSVTISIFYMFFPEKIMELQQSITEEDLIFFENLENSIIRGGILIILIGLLYILLPKLIDKLWK